MKLKLINLKEKKINFFYGNKLIVTIHKEETGKGIEIGVVRYLNRRKRWVSEIVGWL